MGMDSDSEELDKQAETLTRESSFSGDVPIPSPQTSSTKVLPPIERNETGCQTDITLVSGSHVSTFRPESLVREISPFPPLPVISTASAPALLKGTDDDVDSSKENKEGSNMSRPLLNAKNSPQETLDEDETKEEAEDDYRSDTQPSDHESVSTYSAISELDGVGPPTILQYIKESTRAKRSVPAPKPLSERFPSVDPTTERGNMCPFCNTELLPVPPLSDGSEDENESPDINKSTSPPYNIKDSERGDGGGSGLKGDMSVFSVESPPPMFASTDLDEENVVPCDGYLYCCEDYYWHLVNKNRMERRDSFYQEGEVMEVKKIDVSPHAPFGSKAARKLAKDRASERVRERELEKVRPQGGGQRPGGGGATTLFSYARQMKTINFALSSRKCLEDGWTVTNYIPPPKTPEPVLFDRMDETQLHPLPGLSIPWQQHSVEFHRYYRNGTTFLTLLPDGTGTCYYPSGTPAVVITLEKPGIFCYYVLSDSDCNAKVMAVCSQMGRITVFHKAGSIFYQSSPIDGNLFNKSEVRTKHWEWDALQPHVHAPPFQPIYFQISPYFSMRCVSLEQQTLVFNYKRYTFKCSVGSRTKKLGALPSEQPQLLQYLKDLSDTKNKINESLRELNNCINSAQHVPHREIQIGLGTGPKSPRKSPDRVAMAV